MAAFVAFLQIHLHFPEAHSLKAKRAELKPIKHALQARLGASVAEVDHQDVWQRSTLAAVLCAGSERGAQEASDAVGRWLDGHLPQGVSMERVIASWSDLEGLG